MLGLKAERGVPVVHLLPGPMDPRVREDDGVWGSFRLQASSFKLQAGTNLVRLAACGLQLRRRRLAGRKR
jgi:hypothetical protein